MLKRYKIILALALLAPGLAVGEESKPIKIIEPKKAPIPARSAAIDTEKFQAGVFVGTLAVEDFNNNLVAGVAFSYQINSDFLVIANYGSADVGRSTFEKREGLDFLTPDERTFSYLNVLGGYKLFTARSFWGVKRKYDSDIYLLGGMGTMDFAGESNLAWSFGASYRVVFTDWLVINADFKDHIFKSNDVFGDQELKTTQNIEFTIGFNALF